MRARQRDAWGGSCCDFGGQRATHQSRRASRSGGYRKTFLVFPVAAFHLAVVAGRIGADQLVANTQLCCGGLKQGRLVAPAAGESVGDLKAVVRLHTFNFHSIAGKGGDHLRRKSADE